MNEKSFREHLDKIAEAETPKMNLWENIAMELQDEKPKKMKRMPRRYAWMPYVAGFILLLGLGMGGYLYYQSQQATPPAAVHSGDPSLPDNLINYVNLSQTVDGVTITIDYVYVDAYRAEISVTTSYMSDIRFQPGCETCTSIMEVQTVDGQVFDQPTGGGGGGGGGTVTEPYLVSSSGSVQYDTSDLLVTGDTLDLIITYTIDPHGQANGSEASADNAPVRNYRFEFSTPFYQAEQGQIENPSFEANELSFDLSNVEAAPSSQSFDLCYSLPTAEEWYPNILVYTGTSAGEYELQIGSAQVDSQGRTVYAVYPEMDKSNNIMLSYNYDAMKACGSFHTQAAYEGNGDIEIIIPYLFLQNMPTSVDEATIQAEQAYFADLGFEFEYRLTNDVNEAHEFDSGFAYSASDHSDSWYIIKLTRYPDAMPQYGAVQYLMNNWLRERYITNVSYPIHFVD